MFESNRVYNSKLLSPAQRAYAKKAVKAGQIVIEELPGGMWKIKKVEQESNQAP